MALRETASLVHDLTTENLTLRETINFLQAQVALLHSSEAKLNWQLEHVKASTPDRIPHPNAPVTFAVAILDASQLPFHHDFLRKGFAGGQAAAATFCRVIQESLIFLPGSEGADQPANVLLFALFDTSQHHSSYLSFIDGFQSCNDSFVIEVDAQLRQSKVVDMLECFLAIDQVKQIFLGGQAPPLHMRPNTYSDEPMAPTEQRYRDSLHKITLLVPPETDPHFPDAEFYEEDAFAFSRVAVPGLFDEDSFSSPETSFESRFSDSDSSIEESKDIVGQVAGADSEILDRVEVEELVLPVTELIKLTLSDNPAPTRPRRARTTAAPGHLNGTDGKERRKSRGRRHTHSETSSPSSRSSPPSSPQSAYDSDQPLGSYQAMLDGESSSVRVALKAITQKIDAHLSLSRQTPPPCNLFYLTKRGCKNPSCKFSHRYRLNAEQLADLKKGCSHTKCNMAQRGRCPDGTDCPYGH